MTTVIKGDSNINLDFSTGGRITGDMSNATVANRVAFQTSTTNGSTTIMALPNGTGSNSQLLLRSSSAATDDSFGQVVLAGGTDFRISSGASGTGTYLPMTFYTGGSERMRVDTSGNVLIGTSTTRTNYSGGAFTPAFQIEKAGDIRASITRDSDDASGPVIYLGKTRGTTVNSNTVVANGDNLGLLSFDGADGTNLVRGAAITAQVDGTPGSADMPGRLLFSTTADGAATATERMRIDSSGNVLVGRSTSDGYRLALLGNTQLTSSIQLTYSGVAASSIGLTSGGAMAFGVDFSTGATERARIDTNGNFYFGATSTTAPSLNFRPSSDGGYFTKNANTTGATTAYDFLINGTRVGAITTSGSNTSYATSSDYRLKEDVQPMTGALAKVAALKPVTYKWKVDGSDGEGFIAHELQEVVPGCVIGEKDAVDEDGSIKPQGIDTSFLVATLTAAIQELKAIVDAQGAEIAALKGQA